MAFFGKAKQTSSIKYPGKRQLIDGKTVLFTCEQHCSDAATGFSGQAGLTSDQHWIDSLNQQNLNLANRPLIFIQPENAVSGAGMASGMSLSGLRTSHFSAAENSRALNASLSVAAGKHLPLLINIISGAGKQSVGGHDDYHTLADTGCIQLFARDAQAVADLNCIGRKIAELSLTPVVIAQDQQTAQQQHACLMPEQALMAEYLGLADDIIPSPTPAQRLLYGESRRRVPLSWDVDRPLNSGFVPGQQAYMQKSAAQRPYFLEHAAAISQQCMQEWADLTGRQYQPAQLLGDDKNDYLIIAQGEIINAAQAICDHLNTSRKLRIGVVDLTQLRPFPGYLISQLVKNKKGVLVLEKTDQPLAEDLPLLQEIRAVISKALENGQSKGNAAYPDYASYKKLDEVPALYSSCFGLGGRELNPGDLIAAIENMLPEGEQQKFFYLGIEFHSDTALSPKQEIHLQQIEQAYPGVRELALKPAATPVELTISRLKVNLHSISGRNIGCITQNIAGQLFEHVDMNISTATEHNIQSGFPQQSALTLNSQSSNVNWPQASDIVMALDSTLFSYLNPVSELKKGGILVLQSQLEDNEAVWASIPAAIQQQLKQQHIQLCYIDGFKHAPTEANTHFIAQGQAFHGALCKLLPTLDGELFSAEKMDSLLEQATSSWQTGYADLQQIDVSQMPVTQTESLQATVPPALSRLPANDDTLSDVHRFWDQTGFAYQQDQVNNLADPFLANGTIPAATSIFRDMTPVRHEHPVWIPENCTACGDCYSLCPDTAIPGLINTVSEVFETNIKRVEKQGRKTVYLRRAVRQVERKYHELTADKTEGDNLTPIMAKAIGETIKSYPADDQNAVAQEFEWFKESMGDFKFALVKPYHDVMNKRQPRSGGLYSITIDPYACKGCMECVKECEDGALAPFAQTTDSVQQLRKDWDYWLDLPTSNNKFSRIDDLDEKIGALHTLLQDKTNYQSMPGGDNANPGNGQKSVVHLFTATVTAVMQPRVKQHIRQIDGLIAGLEKHIRLKLAENLDIRDADAIEDAIDHNQNVDLTLAKLSFSLDENKASQPINKAWLRWTTQLIAKMQHLKSQYTQGIAGNGRSVLGVCNSADSSAEWGGAYPYNPYPFPWASQLENDAPALARGLFTGHMLKMAEGFKTLRIAELEIANKYDSDEHDDFFARFNWQDFSAEEHKLCPPVVCIGDQHALSEAGMDSLSQAIAGDTPIKILVLNDTRYENGAQALDTAFARRELALMAMAHQNSYVLQSAQSHLNHLLEGFIDGINYRGPALWNVYTASQPQHGIADDMATRQSKMAVESRAFPLLTFDPQKGINWKQRLSLSGNPEFDSDWNSYTLNYLDEYGNAESMSLPFTFADWALTEARFSPFFTRLNDNQAADNLVALHEFIDLDPQDQADSEAFIWALDSNSQQCVKVQVDKTLAAFTRERRDYWRMLKNLTGKDEVKIDTQAIANKAKAEAAQSLVSGLMNLVAEGNADDLLTALTSAQASVNVAAPAAPPAATPPALAATTSVAAPASQATGGHDAVWIDTPDCTTCDECVDINPKIFEYNDDKKAVVIDPTAGTFEDIVRAAEKCTAVIIHPGTPWNPDEPNLDKLIKRAEKFQ